MVEKDTINPMLGYWLSQLEQAERREGFYRSKVEKIIRRYRDERDSHDRASRFNILWSNVETLKPALYSSTPKPQIERRYKDSDPVTRQASMVLERALTTNLDLSDFDIVMRACVQDLLLAGRGVARLRYVPQITPDYQNDGSDKLSDEKLLCDYVYWKDFLHAPARRWCDVSWVAFRNYLSYQQMQDRFGEKIIETPISYSSQENPDSDAINGKAIV